MWTSNAVSAAKSDAEVPESSGIQQIACPYCGDLHDMDDAICPHCGRRLMEL